MTEEIMGKKILAYCVYCEAEKEYEKQKRDYKEQLQVFLQHPKRITWKREQNRGIGYWVQFIIVRTLASFWIGIFALGIVFIAIDLIQKSRVNLFESIFLWGFAVSYVIGALYLALKDHIEINPKRPKRPMEPSWENILSNWQMNARNKQESVNHLKRYLYKYYLNKCTNFEELDTLDGYTFEEYMGSLFRSMDYKDVVVTKRSGDNGVDLVIHSDEKGKIAVQCKRQKINNPVGVGAIQEVYAGKGVYDCTHAMVVTTSYFTKAAKTMAAKLKVELWDRNILREKHSMINSSGMTWKEFLMQYYVFPEKKSKINIS